MSSGPAGEKLLVANLLMQGAHEVLPVDEARVVKAMDPMSIPQSMDSVADVSSHFVGLLRTAGIFVLDTEQVWDALASEAPSDLPEFPPLPFRRVWIECHLDGSPYDYMRFSGKEVDELRNERPEEFLAITGCGIVEVEQGKVWDVYTPFLTSDADKWRENAFKRPIGETGMSFSIVAHRCTPHEIIAPDLGEEVFDLEKAARTIISLAVNGAHLITARNVPHRELVMGRAQRKRLQRETKREYRPGGPKLYYVDLHHAGEQTVGGADREYHVRWLVRGHWFHQWVNPDYGDRMCTCLEHKPGEPPPPWPANWKDGYVKGPIGAPWKGRPVYSTEQLSKIRKGQKRHARVDRSQAE